MFYLVVYNVRLNGEVCSFHSSFIHTSSESARDEAESKKFFGTFPVLNYYIDIVFFKK